MSLTSDYVTSNTAEAAQCAAKSTSLVEGLIRVSMVSDAADHGVNSTQFMKLLAVNLSAVLVMFVAVVAVCLVSGQQLRA